MCLVISQWQNHAKCIKTQVLGLIKWIKHVYCNKISRKFVRTVSCIRCTNRTQIVTTVLTVAKSCKTHQNISFGSNKIVWGRLLRKNLRESVRKVLCIQCKTWTQFIPVVLKVVKWHKTQVLGLKRRIGHVCFDKISRNFVRIVLFIRCTIRT